MNEEEKIEMHRMYSWVSNSPLFGKEPYLINYTNSFVENGIKCYIFKFKLSLLGSWFIGITSNVGIISTKQKYKNETEIEDARELFKLIYNYEQNKEILEINTLSYGSGCMASKKIFEENYKVGYMRRGIPTYGDPDSGWEFFVGDETDDYSNNIDNFAVYNLSTIIEHDKTIEKYLSATNGAQFIRINDNEFIVDDNRERDRIYISKK